MLDMVVSGTPEEIINWVERLCPEVRSVLREVRSRAEPIKLKREIYEYQAACLYLLAKQYNWAGAQILEIGTAYGYSASVIATAAPLASITTLNPKEHEVVVARERLRRYGNVNVIQMRSQDYLQVHNGAKFELGFVDGDHAHIVEDLPWWDYIQESGLFLFHDYSPLGSGRPCPPVYEALNDFRDSRSLPMRVRVIDDQNVGLAGFYHVTRPVLADSTFPYGSHVGGIT